MVAHKSWSPSNARTSPKRISLRGRHFSTDLTKNIENFHAKLLLERKSQRQIRETDLANMDQKNYILLRSITKPMIPGIPMSSGIV